MVHVVKSVFSHVKFRFFCNGLRSSFDVRQQQQGAQGATGSGVPQAIQKATQDLALGESNWWSMNSTVFGPQNHGVFLKQSLERA